MIQKITLNLGGQEQTFQKVVTARMCRTAYEARSNYIDGYNKSKGVISDAMMDKLVDWLVEAYDCQFTAEQFWDGYSGSFLEIREMMDNIITETSNAVIEFPKRAPEAGK